MAGKQLHKHIPGGRKGERGSGGSPQRGTGPLCLPCCPRCSPWGAELGVETESTCGDGGYPQSHMLRWGSGVGEEGI